MLYQGSQNQIHSEEGDRHHPNGYYQGLQKERTIDDFPGILELIEINL